MQKSLIPRLSRRLQQCHLCLPKLTIHLVPKKIEKLLYISYIGRSPLGLQAARRINRHTVKATPDLFLTITTTTMAPMAKDPRYSGLLLHVKSQAKRVASATYYRKNADIIREKRRIQMAEKRLALSFLQGTDEEQTFLSAQIKAKRRKSDKPRPPPKKNLKSAPLESPFPQIPSPRILAESESEASDALLTMARQPAQQPVLPPAPPDPRMRANEPFDEYDLIARANERDVDSEDSDDAEAGHRTISEVADAMPSQGRSIEVGEDENVFLMHGVLLTPERERSALDFYRKTAVAIPHPFAKIVPR
ncbi:hypothetical protein R3P38DRAFT_2760882 [Favolaschia claudopus]|uniref:Uncharacterized protein n=1 Tax=Favolaschia claudopus TaxID=2862362 RepID=A0AAW0DVF5_9AGAR